jgi:hypothetical protein
VAVVCLPAFAACGGAEHFEPREPARIEAVDGSALPAIVLAAEASRRLGIETALVRQATEGMLEVPYAALLYEPGGATWVYTSPDGHAFVRAPVEVDRIDGGIATLRSGPPVGTPVVIVGVAELYGAELGIG